MGLGLGLWLGLGLGLRVGLRLGLGSGLERRGLAPRSEPGREDEPAAELVLGCDAGAGG